MRLTAIKIYNYRSVEDISFEIDEIEDSSYTYGLIGVNEAGKSSLLKAIALKDSLITLNQKDFKSKNKPVIVELLYKLTPSEIDHIKTSQESSDLAFSEITFDKLLVQVYYNYESPSAKNTHAELISKDEKTTFDIAYELIKDEIHSCRFWTAEDKFLISQPINLSNFSANPDNVSIPLRNCFLLSGFEDIKEAIANTQNDSTEIEYLQDTLSRKVTEHIKSVWPNHPIEITFLISSGLINFHIKDIGASKAKTADQRSDGFKQFVSFLLTISAQSKNSELENTILLLDEPEIHLHPQAQVYLLEELISITRNKKNNIVLFATHSNYMIDKNNLSRNFRVVKIKDATETVKLSNLSNTYSSVTYEVFDIPSTDYHNELYGKLHEKFQSENLDDESRAIIKVFDNKYFNEDKKLKKSYRLRNTDNGCTLPTYIRNCIHHPDNGNKYTEDDLRQSIKWLKDFND